MCCQPYVVGRPLSFVCLSRVVQRARPTLPPLPLSRARSYRPAKERPRRCQRAVSSASGLFTRHRLDWRPCAGRVHSFAGGATCGGRDPHCSQRLNISECRRSAPPAGRKLNAVAARSLLPAKQHKMTPIALRAKSAADCLRVCRLHQYCGLRSIGWPIKLTGTASVIGSRR